MLIKTVQKVYFLFLLLFSALANIGFAQSEQEPATSSEPAVTSETPQLSTDSDSPPKSTVKRGKRTREKEAEGSQAPNRFETGTGLKSKYTRDGKPLEVDPD